MGNFIQRNMAIFLAPVLTVAAITLYNLVCLVLRHHHEILHELHRAAGAMVLLIAFYGIIRYMQSLPDDES
ncbi:hypothetical protein FP026_16330 [Rhizobium tropici]|uniref:Uncharacterized protein n=1 Tax=Rhizobium tropici TaxID=398 RepID=A0A5B0W2Y4_RHITR|nr:hypothetical protein [Rhizobium tropici]KAA1180401.1 hypothetical protein FP026_16330 [Rhizobium tropici]